MNSRGKRKYIITRSASGEDKVKEAILVVMGEGWYFEDNTPNKKPCTFWEEVEYKESE